MEKLSFKNSELEEIIIRIFNETYEDFVNKYGEKHKEYIKQMLENISDKVQKIEMYEGALAAANVTKGIVYGKSDELPAILKHELWHVFNESSFATETSYAKLPERYINFLDNAGIIRKEYEIKMKEYQEKWKDKPDVLKYLLVDYDTFLKNYNLGGSETEKWTEWFNSRTNVRDMKERYVDLGNGFYMGGKSSSSLYDYYINLCDMISCIIPEDKLLDMHLNTEHHKTDYSFQKMISDFDNNYSMSLDENEREKYGFPYLKILCETRIIDENAKKNDKVTLEAIQSCMDTCFKAYLCKMNNFEKPTGSNLKSMYSEIKKMQKYMVWNVDIEKMEGLPYIQEMLKIEDKFKEMCGNLEKENPEIQQMMNNIGYKDENEFEKINNGDEIAKKIFAKNDGNYEEKQYGEYTVKVNETGIKGNLYKNTRIVFGDTIFNQLLKKCNDQEDNEISKLYQMIENINDTDVKSIEQTYNYLYSLYENKMNSILITDENSSSDFKNCYNDIKQMQELALFQNEDKKYIENFENILNLYKQKVEEFKKYIDYATKVGIKETLEKTGYDSSNSKNKLAMDKKDELDDYIFYINETQKNRINEKLSLKDIGNVTHTIGLQEIDAVTQEIKNTYKQKNIEGEKNGR